MARPVKLFNMVFPVISMRKNPATGRVETATNQIYGTAFPIAPGLFMTAEHVASAAAADGRVCVSRIPSNPGAQMPSYPARACYVFPEFDVGLLVIDVPDAVPVPLVFDQPLDNLQDVETTGFPLAVDPEWLRVVPRSFKGSVVTRRTVFEKPGQPAGYELTFPAPPGLSGAPLFYRATTGAQCHAMVISEVGIGTAGRSVQFALALDVRILLSLSVKELGGSLAPLWRRPAEPAPAIAEKQLPGGLAATSDSETWPD